MLKYACVVVALCLFCLVINTTDAQLASHPATVIASFESIDFTFLTSLEAQNFQENKYYRNCAIAGVKIDSRGNIYVSLPRWKPHVPATLAKVVRKDGVWKLEPFPDWDWNTPSATRSANSTLYSVLGFEIDANDKMYILDQGKVNNEPAVSGAIKVVVYDLANGQLDKVIPFSPEMASPTNSFMNDIVVDTTKNIAYITDSGIPLNAGVEKLKPALLVVNLSSNEIVRVLDSHYSTLNEDIWIQVNHKPCLRTAPMITGADGIALSCDFSILYWTPLTSRTLYAINTTFLQQALVNITQHSASVDAVLSSNLVNLGYKLSASDGLACSARRGLFITAIEHNTIYAVDEHQLTGYLNHSRSVPLNNGTLSALMTPVFDNIADSNTMIWPDTIGFSADGYIYFVANNLCAFIQDELDFSTGVTNFRIWRKYVGEISYVHGCQSRRPAAYGTLTVAETAAIVISVVSIVLTVGMVISCVVRRVLFSRKNAGVGGGSAANREPYNEGTSLNPSNQYQRF